MIRKSKRWAFFERFDVPNVTQAHWGELHFVRWRIVQTPLASLYVHRFDSPDAERMHDHPWSFLSVVLRGGYEEDVPFALDGEHFGVTPRRITRWNFKRATDAHLVRRLLRTPTWTLVVTGPRRRDWGYIDQRTGEWTRFDLSPWEQKFQQVTAERTAR